MKAQVTYQFLYRVLRLGQLFDNECGVFKPDLKLKTEMKKSIKTDNWPQQDMVDTINSIWEEEKEEIFEARPRLREK